MSAALESRYRAALRWYPRSWRAANADAIVGTMLDQAAAEGRDAPARGELRDLAASGFGMRFERFAPQAVRDRVAVIALAIGAAYAVIMFLGSEWAPFAETGPLNGWMFPEGDARFREYSSMGFGPFASVLVLVHGLWIAAFVLVMLRFSAIAKILLLATIPLLGWIRSLRFDDIGSWQPTTPVLIVVALLAVAASVGNPARVRRATLGAIAVAVAAVSTVASVVGAHPPIYEGRLSAQVGSFSVLNAPAFAVLLVVVGVVLAIRGHRSWAVAALVPAAPWLMMSSFYVVPLPLSVLSIAVALGFGAPALIAAALVRNRGAAPDSASAAQ